MNNNENYRKIAIECAVCKTKFELWIEMSRFTPELEENIRKNFYRYCPICKMLEQMELEKGN